MSDYGYLIQKDNYGKSSNVDKYRKIVEDMQTESTKKAEVTNTPAQALNKTLQNMQSAYETHKVEEGAKLVNQAQNLMNMQQDKILKGTGNLTDYAKTLTPEKTQEIKATSAVLNPQLLEKKNPDAKYYFGKFAQGTNEALENAVDATIALNSNLGIAQNKAIQNITSLGGLVPNKISEYAKGQAEKHQQVKEDVYSKDFLPTKDLAETLEYEYAPNKIEALAGDVLSGVGGMLPTIATNLLAPGAGYVTLGLQGAGGGTKQAYNETGNLGAAQEIYGALSGLAEIAVEKLSGGIGGLGNGAVDNIAAKLIKNGFIRNATGEGIEEAITTFIDPYLQRLTYNKGAEGAKVSEILRSALIGSLTSMLLQGGSAAVNLPQTIQQNKENRAELRNSLKGLDKMLPNYDNAQKSVNAEKNNAPELPTNDFQEQGKQTILPTQKIQETVNSAKIAGMSDFDVKKATEIHKMLQSGSNLKFYDSKNVPAGVDSRAINANGFYKDGTLWINKDSKRQVEKILGHELTHHLENTETYSDFAKSIFDSNLFYDYITSQGYDNVEQFKENLRQRGYSDKDMDYEMVSMFAEDNLFDSQEKIDRLARENRTLAQKILNWLSDMKTKLVGTSQEKELLRIENMYRKALSQAGNAETNSNNAQYSYSGEVGLNNLKQNVGEMNSAQRKFVRELDENYNVALQMNEKGYSNEKILKETGWFMSDGKWRWEIPDTLMTLKKNIRLEDGVSYDLGDILEHDLLFMVYPDLMTQQVVIDNNMNGKGKYNTITKNIKLKVEGRTQGNIELTLLHEVQHAIQDTEGFEGGTSPLGGKLRYYEHKGEIEAADTTRRLLQERQAKKNGEIFDREKVAPELSKENPEHPGLKDYLASDKQTKIRDNIYKRLKGGAGNETESFDIEDVELENNETNNETLGQNNSRRRVAGREPAFSLPEIPKGHTRLYRGLTQEYNNKYDKSKLDNSNGYESWTDSYDLAKAYGDNVYYIDVPTSEIKNDIIDNDSKSETYGDRNLIYFNDKPVGIKGKSGNEYMLYTDHDNYSNIEYKKVENSNKSSFSLPETDNQGRKLTTEQQEFFKDSKVRDEEGRLKAVYHGTAEDFTIFDEMFAKEGDYGVGFYFSDVKGVAEESAEGKMIDKDISRYASGDKGQVMETYLDMKKPSVWYNYRDIYKYNKMAKEAGLSFYDYMRKNYDGIIVTNPRYENEGFSESKYYIVFHPNQIKNVDNTNPTENADIRYSVNAKEDNTSNARALSRYAQTLQRKHKDIPEHVNLIQKEIDNGNFMHEVIRDKRSLNYAENYIKDNGFEDAVKHWDELMKRGKAVDKDELALGQTIYNLAVENKDTRLVMKMASDLVQEYTEIGRNLQSATLLRKMTPDGRLYALERSVQKINQDLMQKFDDFENIQIPETLADELLRSETQNQMDEAVEKIQIYIANQIPATWQERLNSLRYLSMLGNPRTHIRNIIGNAVFIPAVEVKNVIAQAGEKFIPQEQRTKAILSKKDDALVKYAENDFDKNKETIRGENKYDIKAGIQEKRTIYSNKALEAARKGNFNLLEAEDTLFLKFRYKRAFAQALKARGMTIEQLRENSPETVRKVNEIRSYAINEAQKATYRDASSVAAMINRSKRKMLNQANQSTGAKKLGYNAAYLWLEGLLPFTKTPVNIVKRGLEYSPAGLITGIYDAAVQVKKGNKTASQAIDEIASGATGTAIVGLGFLLASLGLVGGGKEEKDKEQALKELQGYQNYALNIFGKSYTIDWSAPSSIPLFIGVELYRALTDEDESNVLQSLMNIAQPVVEMSMLQGINDALTTLGEDSAIGNVASEMLLNYLGQYNPTLFGQIARTIDPVRRTTYVNKNIKVPAKVQRFIQQQVAKMPGASKLLPSYKDQFGQEQITDSFITRVFQNFLSPGYIKDIKEGPVEKGLAELYERTGETKIIPSYASKTLTLDGEKINLTAKEYDTYAKTRGNVSMKGLEGLLGDKNYKNLSDEQKTKVIEGIYDYANDVAKSKVLKGFELEGNSKKTKELESKGMDFYKFIMIKKTADTDGNGYVSDSELNKAISKYDATKWKGLIKKKEK